MKIGFIGLGNMATAIIGGMLAKGMTEPENVIGYDKYETACEKIKSKYNITVAMDAKEVVRNAEVLFMAVKPNVLGGVLEEIKDVITENTLIISIAAGRSISFIEEHLCNKNCKIVRCMPNTPALVLEGCTGVCKNDNVNEEDMEKALKLLSSFGRASVVPESMMDVVVGVSGSSPAYVFMFIEAMADAAVAEGMPRAQAYEFAAQAVLGSAKLVLETGKHPGELKDMVCSPGGTTIQAVKVLEEKGMRAAVMDAMEACIEKSRNL